MLCFLVTRRVCFDKIHCIPLAFSMDLTALYNLRQDSVSYTNKMHGPHLAALLATAGRSCTSKFGESDFPCPF